MIKDCYIEAWLRTNSWDAVNHGHGTLYLKDLAMLPTHFEEVDGRPIPRYDREVKDDPLTAAIHKWYDGPCERPCKSITEFRLRVWLQPRRLLLYVQYCCSWDWKPKWHIPGEPVTEKELTHACA